MRRGRRGFRGALSQRPDPEHDGGAMPFSSLTDPIDLARAEAALEKAWTDLKPSLPPGSEERERNNLAYIVAGLVHLALDEDDLAQRAVLRYREKA